VVLHHHGEQLGYLVPDSHCTAPTPGDTDLIQCPSYRRLRSSGQLGQLAERFAQRGYSWEMNASSSAHLFSSRLDDVRPDQLWQDVMDLPARIGQLAPPIEFVATPEAR
jgi:hypothetical protein